MDKPTPGELKNVDVQFVSFVDRGANRAKFRIFKSEVPPAKEPEAPAQAKSQEPAKAEGEPKAEVEKAEYRGYSLVTALGVEEAEAGLWQLFDAVRMVYSNIVASAELIDKNAAIAQLAEDLKARLLRQAEGLGVAKAEQAGDAENETVEKAGRKIAASRLEALKEARTLLEQIISEVESPAGNGEPTGSAQGVAKAEAPEAKAASEPQGETAPKAEDTKKAGASLSGAVEAAVTKALEPVLARVNVLEKARGVSNQIIDEKVEKRTAGTFGGVIFGRR